MNFGLSCFQQTHTRTHKVCFLPCYHGQARAVRSAVLEQPGGPEWPWRWPPSSWVIPLRASLCLTQQCEQHTTIQMLWQGALLECCSSVCEPQGWRDGWTNGLIEREGCTEKRSNGAGTQHGLNTIWSKQIMAKKKSTSTTGHLLQTLRVNLL